MELLVARARPSSDRPDADLEDGSDSPNLERLRAARSKMAELELERQKGRLLPVEQVREAIRELGAILRRVGQTLERQEWLQGSEARQRIEEGLDEFERLAVRKFGPDASDAPQDDQSAAQ